MAQPLAEKSSKLLALASELDSQAEAVRFRAGEVAAGRPLRLAVGCWQGLPDAVVRSFFMLLPPKIRGKCALVSSSWRLALQSPSLWALLEFAGAETSARSFLGAVRRANGTLNSLTVRGNYSSYYMTSAQGLEACAGNAGLQRLVIEPSLTAVEVAAVFASCPGADFGASVAVAHRDVETTS